MEPVSRPGSFRRSALCGKTARRLSKSCSSLARAQPMTMPRLCVSRCPARFRLQRPESAVHWLVSFWTSGEENRVQAAANLIASGLPSTARQIAANSGQIALNICFGFGGDGAARYPERASPRRSDIGCTCILWKGKPLQRERPQAGYIEAATGDDRRRPPPWSAICDHNGKSGGADPPRQPAAAVLCRGGSRGVAPPDFPCHQRKPTVWAKAVYIPQRRLARQRDSTAVRRRQKRWPPVGRAEGKSFALPVPSRPRRQQTAVKVQQPIHQLLQFHIPVDQGGAQTGRRWAGWRGRRASKSAPPCLMAETKLLGFRAGLHLQLCSQCTGAGAVLGKRPAAPATGGQVRIICGGLPRTRLDSSSAAGIEKGKFVITQPCVVLGQIGTA